MSDALLRQVLILQKLPRFPLKKTTRELQSYLQANGFGRLSLRTVQRDLQQLSLRFGLIEVPGSGRGNEGAGWAFAPDAKVLAGGLDSTAALALLFAERYLTGLMPQAMLEHLNPWLDEARRQLNAQTEGQHRGWASKVRFMPRGMPLTPATVAPGVLETLQQALLENRQIMATYRGKEEQRIHPLGLIHRGRITHLACTFFDYEDVRLTDVHRFESASLLDKTARSPAGFDIDEWLTSGVLDWPVGQEKTVVLKLRFSDHAGHHLLETPINASQQTEDCGEGCLHVSATVADTMELRWWLLGFGEQVEVISPKPLRQWFAGNAKSMNRLYSRVAS